MRLMMLAALAATAPLAAQDFNWNGRLAAGQTLEVRGINGTIDAVAASGAEARVTGRKEDHGRGDPDEVLIVTVPHDGGMLICAVYPENDPDEVCRPGRGGNHNTRNNNVSVDFRVEVPAGVQLIATTVNGEVDIRDLRADVRARTVNGDLYVETAGFAEASTVNGSLHVRIGRTDWTGEASYSTVNGTVTLEVPAGLATRFEAETVNGSIESDFPITIRGRFGPRRATGTIGGESPGRSLEVRTVNGSIILRRV